MSQGALAVANGSGLAVRSAINAALARLSTKAAGTGRPADIATFETWIETDNPGSGIVSIWQWDGTNDVLVGLFDTAAHKITQIADDMLVDHVTANAFVRGATSFVRLTGTTETLQADYSGKIIVLFNASPVTLTVPPGLPQGFGVVLAQTSNGQVTLTEGAGVTFLSRTLGKRMNGIYSRATLDWAGQLDEYLIAGDLTV